MTNIEQYLIEKADQCLRLARAGREVADSLETMGNDLMAQAVALDTARDRGNKDERPVRSATRKA